MAIDRDQLLQGNRRALAKAITLIESKLPKHREEAQALLEAILPNTGKSIRVGISGTPGVGKSTFIEAFGKFVISLGKKVAVLAIDPSSPLAGGSILGDKTRMEELSRDPNAYIRPSPSSGQLGGVAQKTRESMLLCEAAGYDVVIVETVGVGQSEYDAAAMVDFFLVLMQPNAGDDLQGIKKGIMELADALVINKADGEGEKFARQAKRYYASAMELVAHPGFWKPKVMTCSARENRNIDRVWEMIEEYKEQACEKGEFDTKRSQQNKEWMQALLLELLEVRMKEKAGYQSLRDDLEAQVVRGETTPLLAAQKIAGLFDA